MQNLENISRKPAGSWSEIRDKSESIAALAGRILEADWTEPIVDEPAPKEEKKDNFRRENLAFWKLFIDRASRSDAFQAAFLPRNARPMEWLPFTGTDAQGRKIRAGYNRLENVLSVWFDFRNQEELISLFDEEDLTTEQTPRGKRKYFRVTRKMDEDLSQEQIVDTLITMMTVFKSELDLVLDRAQSADPDIPAFPDYGEETEEAPRIVSEQITVEE